jgi:hypothetical protein
MTTLASTRPANLALDKGRATETKELYPDRSLWSKQFRESKVAFEAFTLYRDMSGRRSASDVARSLDKSVSLVSRWARLWSWILRAEAFDRYMDEERISIKLQAAHDALDSMETMGRNLSTRSYNALISAFDVDERGNVTTKLTAGDLIKLQQLSVEVWRRSLGIPDRTQTEVTGPNGGPQQIQQEVALKIDADDIAAAIDVLRDVGAVRPTQAVGADSAGDAAVEILSPPAEA